MEYCCHLHADTHRQGSPNEATSATHAPTVIRMRPPVADSEETRPVARVVTTTERTACRIKYSSLDQNQYEIANSIRSGYIPRTMQTYRCHALRLIRSIIFACHGLLVGSDRLCRLSDYAVSGFDCELDLLPEILQYGVHLEVFAPGC